MPRRNEGKATVMKPESIKALGGVPARPEDLPEGLLEDLKADGIIAYKIPGPAMPKVVHQGKYRLYEKPDGGLRIQYKRDDKETEDFLELPGAMVALAKAAGEGKIGPMEMMKSVMGFMKNGGL
jgi:hypothetical protein